MGLAFSSLMKLLAFTKKDVRMLMVGLDGAGKTTILYKLKLDEVVSSIPTIGFNVETLEYKNLRITVWDVGGQYGLRKLWHHYFVNAGAVIFVVDSSDCVRMQEACSELQKIMMCTELKNTVLLVFANKQDLPNAMSESKMAQELCLNELHQPWYIHPIVATKGQGLWEGLDKLIDMLEQHNK